MKNLTDKINKKYFIRLGEFRFSPIMEASAGLSLEYCELVQKSKSEKQPFFFCFPEKKGASLWTSIAILTNYFFEDYIDNEVEGIKFNRGDKVKIYNCIAEVERTTDDIVFLKFKYQGGIPINKRLRPHLSHVNSNRALSLVKKFWKNHKDNKSNRNPISKILAPSDSITINQNNLESKVLLISGRGNLRVFRELLNSTEIYGETLSKIYPENKNLIIKPDLESYKDLLNSNNGEDIREFKKWLKLLFDEVEINEIKLILSELIDLLPDNKEISQEFDSLFNLLINEYENDLPKLKHLSDKYPGYRDLIPEKLRAVVINDISQISNYQNTINGFLELGIPVIFISNRCIEKSNELEFYTNLFRDNSDYYRINWNRKKIKALEDLASGEYIDSDLWRQCLRYSNQHILMNISEKNELDNIIPNLQKQIRELDDFENLQKSFYNNFYPALYALKNSKQSNGYILDLIQKFKENFNEVKHFGISSEIIENIENSIKYALRFVNNNKDFDTNENIFSTLLFTNLTSRIYIPLEKNHINIPNSKTKDITFTGYPYYEYSGKYLLNAVCVDFVPEIKIVCWPSEASLTHGYILRRLLAGYFCDYLNGIKLVPDKYLLKKEDDFEKEINSYLVSETLIEVDDKQEDNLEYLHTFKYNGYSNSTSGNSSFTVKCDILNFDDGSFMFLPKSGTVLSEVEDSDGKLKIRNAKFNDLSVGLKIFKYKKDRSTYRKISRQNEEIEQSFIKLDLWKEVLERLYSSSHENINLLEELLLETKKKFNLIEGNPIRSNIQRWLFDDEVIKPDTTNLKIILYSAGLTNVEQIIDDQNSAYNEVKSYTIGLSSSIKKSIIKKLSSPTFNSAGFTTQINGSEIDVESRVITSLDNNEMVVDYHNTRKILC